jgi:alpha-amylase
MALTFADDGEKFGFWPKTYQWVFEEGWLERFFCALEQESSWLKTATFRDYLTQVGCSGRVYLPCGSYEEMLEWSGGYFRNFFVKYPEANAMYHKMLAVSQRVRTAEQATGSGHRHNGSELVQQEPAADASAAAQARQELYMAQCNCAYWHGVFGGLYLAHLRRAVYQHLLTAERLARSAQGTQSLEELADVDQDGDAELILSNPQATVIVDPAESGSLTELSVFDPPANLTDTLTRRYEPYHEKLKAKQAHQASADRAPASIHDLVDVREQGLADVLLYDDHRRASLLDYAFSAMPSLQEIMRCALSHRLLWKPGPWTLQPRQRSAAAQEEHSAVLHRRVGDALLKKSLTLSSRQPCLRFRLEAEAPVPVVGLEFNLGIFDERCRQASWEESLTSLQLRDPFLGLGIEIAVEPAATLARFPIETVSESEEGLERTPQGVALMWLWQTAGKPRWACELRWTIKKL